MEEDLKNKKCGPCEGESDVLSEDEIEKLSQEVPEWKTEGNKSIDRNFQFKDFKEALDFVNKVGEIAEAEGHHPDIKLHSYNKVEITLSTHAIGGLSENDFILASKIDELLR